MIQLGFFRTPDGTSQVNAGNRICLVDTAKQTNSMLPSDDAPTDFQAPAHVQCDGHKCVGYASWIETALFKAILKGWSISFVAVDFSQYGDLTATVQRMNQ